MVSTAADKSSRTRITSPWESSILKISLLTLSRADSDEWCFLYADCKEGNSPWQFR